MFVLSVCGGGAGGLCIGVDVLRVDVGFYLSSDLAPTCYLEAARWPAVAQGVERVDW